MYSSIAAVTCVDLTSLDNGGITYSSVDANARAVDSTATYSCMTGFTLTGNIIRTCQSDGMWSGMDPTCEGKRTSLGDHTSILLLFCY